MWGGRQRGNIESKALRADKGGAAASTLKQRPQKENKRKEPQNKPGANDLRPLRSSLPRGIVQTIKKVRFLSPFKERCLA